MAEGIETVEQLEAIRRLSISSGQGYLLAVPAPHTSSLRIDVDLLVESHRARRHAILESWELPQDVAAWGISGDRIAFRSTAAESAERQPPGNPTPTKAPANPPRARKPRAPRTGSPTKVAPPARARRRKPAA